MMLVLSYKILYIKKSSSHLLRLVFYLLLPLIALNFSSCKKDLSDHVFKTTDEVRFPQTEQEKELASLTKEIQNVLLVVYAHSKALEEVNAAIYSGFSVDESISIKDLLQPDGGALYNYSDFIKRHITPGSFFKYFKEETSNGKYPLINKYYGIYLQNKPFDVSSSLALRSTTTTSHLPDSNLLKIEIWVVNSVKIYFPYSENFSATYDPGGPTNTYSNPGGPVVTTVSADREADSGPGQEPYWVTDSYGVQHLTSRQVIVDDTYAEVTATHIVNVMDYPQPPPIPAPTTPGPIYTVYIGWVRCNHQYDHLISLKNGGGSELWFGEGYASRDASTGQINPNFPANPVYLSRKDIRKNRWVHPFVVWDTNWKIEQTNHALGIWEEDTQGSQTFTGSLSGEFKVGTVTLKSTVGYSKTIVSQDPILRNTNIDRDYYFRTAAQNVEFRGFQDGWPIRNADGHVDFTMPYQIF